MNVETVNELKQSAWVQASAELAGIESRVNNTKKADATEDEVRELYEDQVVPYLLAHMTRSEAVCAMATTHGIIPEQAVAVLMGALRSFCQSASHNRKAFCRAKVGDEPCTWRGQVADAGPVGVCPLCSSSPVSILDLSVPPSTNGRLRLVP